MTHDIHPEPGPDVTVTINGQDFSIHRGRRSVAEIKSTGNVPAAEELEQIVDGVFSPLGDSDSITIKGGEVFVSHVRAGAAS
jgi:hypothetical protein